MYTPSTITTCYTFFCCMIICYFDKKRLYPKSNLHYATCYSDISIIKIILWSSCIQQVQQSVFISDKVMCCTGLIYVYVLNMYYLLGRWCMCVIWLKGCRDDKRICKILRENLIRQSTHAQTTNIKLCRILYNCHTWQNVKVLSVEMST